jgi:hypothetical protein
LKEFLNAAARRRLSRPYGDLTAVIAVRGCGAWMGTSEVEHEALMQGGATKEVADMLVEGSIENLIAQGVEGPMKIPYARRDDAGGK